MADQFTSTTKRLVKYALGCVRFVAIHTNSRMQRNCRLFPVIGETIRIFDDLIYRVARKLDQETILNVLD